MNSYFEPGRELPVVREVDVVIAGGGPAGFAAAMAAELGIELRDIDVKDVQKRLLEQGVSAPGQTQIER